MSNKVHVPKTVYEKKNRPETVNYKKMYFLSTNVTLYSLEYLLFYLF